MSVWRDFNDALRDGSRVLLAIKTSNHPATVTLGWYDASDTRFPWQFVDGDNELNALGDSPDSFEYWKHLPDPPGGGAM